jgi:hypothetical protein
MRAAAGERKPLGLGLRPGLSLEAVDRARQQDSGRLFGSYSSQTSCRAKPDEMTPGGIPISPASS